MCRRRRTRAKSAGFVQVAATAAPGHSLARARAGHRRRSRPPRARGPDRRRDRARPGAGRSAVRLPAADRRRLRRQVRPAERLQRLPRRPGVLRPRPGPLSARSRGVARRGDGAVPRSRSPGRPERRAPRTDVPRASVRPRRRSSPDGTRGRRHGSRAPGSVAAARARTGQPFQFPTIHKSTLRQRAPNLDGQPSVDSGRVADAARSSRRGRRSARSRGPGRPDRRHAGRGQRQPVGDRDARGAGAARRAARFGHRRRRGADHGDGAQPVHRPRSGRCSPTWSRGRRCAKRISSASASSGCTG